MLVAQPFDPARAVVTGEPIPVVQDVGLDEAVYRGAFAVSATGVLAHRAGRENGVNSPGSIAPALRGAPSGRPMRPGSAVLNWRPMASALR